MLVPILSVVAVIFTFHNVSINSTLRAASFDQSSYLHSTMFLLILDSQIDALEKYCDLHSTMFLLIPSLPEETGRQVENLHSTMFLLIPMHI